MPTYDIQRWDAVIPPGKTEPYPMIYIKPDKDFIEYAKANDYRVAVVTSETGSIYDIEPVMGLVDSSALFPTIRPNFYDETGYYVITLLARWLGYPDTNGKVIIQGMDEVRAFMASEPEQPFRAPAPMISVEGYTPSTGFSQKQVTWIGVILVVIFLVLFLASLRK